MYDYREDLRERRLAEEEQHRHVVEGYVVCRYHVVVEYDDREYDSFDTEELMVDEACRKFNDDIYYNYDEIEILKED